MYDIIIIGGGPAGVSAGIYAASRGKKTLLIEKKRIGGIIGNVSTVTHYTAIMQPETGESFATRMWNQIKNCGVEIINEEVVSTSLKGDVKSVTTDKNTYSAKKVIIAAGSTPRKLDIEGEKPLDGKYIYLNAAKDGERFKGKNIYVVGGADGAIKEALYLSQIASVVHLVHRRGTFKAEPILVDKLMDVVKEGKIVLHTPFEVEEVLGDDKGVTGLKLKNFEGGADEELAVDGVFIAIGHTPNTKVFAGELNTEGGYIVTDKAGFAATATNVEGVFAAGDCADSIYRQAVTSAGSGCMAALDAQRYLEKRG